MICNEKKFYWNGNTKLNNFLRGGHDAQPEISILLKNGFYGYDTS